VRVLVAGIGDRLMGDDGLGPAVVERLKSADLPPCAEVEDYGKSLMELLMDLSEFDALILIDAFRRGGAPGSVYVMEIGREDLEDVTPETASSVASMTFHELSVEAVLALAKALGFLPARVLLIGVEPSRVEFGQPLSDPVEEAVPRVVDIVARELRALCSDE